MIIAQIFTTYIYQPFFNLLVLIYWGLQQLPFLPHRDMGVAVIVFTIALRFILLPLTLAASRSEKERREIEAKAKTIKEELHHHPIQQRKEMKLLFKANPRILISESVNLFIQVSIALMLWRIFASGLGGADFHLLYGFIPEIEQPFNLFFWDLYDLTHPILAFNLIQTVLIFLVETVNVLTSPYPHSKKDVFRLQLVLPLVSFAIFFIMPAGKKLFIITTLSFTLAVMLLRQAKRKFNQIFNAEKDVEEPEKKEAEAVVTTQVAK